MQTNYIQPLEISEESIRQNIQASLDKNVILRSIVKGSGYYDKVLVNLPRLIIHLNSTQEGLTLLKTMGLYDYFSTQSN